MKISTYIDKIIKMDNIVLDDFSEDNFKKVSDLIINQYNQKTFIGTQKRIDKCLMTIKHIINTNISDVENNKTMSCKIERYIRYSIEKDYISYSKCGLCCLFTNCAY
jgi:hypothetical protein